VHFLKPSLLDDGFGEPSRGKAMDQHVGTAAYADPNAADGVESAATVDVSNSARTHGNEGQDVALSAAGRCVHGGNNNRSYLPAIVQ
jgi:hypothetical protein